MLYTLIILNTGLLLIDVLRFTYAEYRCSTLYAEYRFITDDDELMLNVLRCHLTY